MTPKWFAVLTCDRGGQKMMCPGAQSAQMFTRLFRIPGLREDAPVAVQDLVATEDECIRAFLRRFSGLHLGERIGNVAWCCAFLLK